jgi:hypothetical protein
LALLLMLLAAPAGAGCRLALALAIDVSKSVSMKDYGLQRDGVIAALADDEVRDLFLLPGNHVTLMIYHWSGADYQGVVVDWYEILGVEDLEAISEMVKEHPRFARNMPTAIGHALEFGRQAMDYAPDCARHVIDVSGDGRNNDGTTPKHAYEWEDFGDITVNGLAIGGHEADLVDYYRSDVIRGPGAFVEVAQDPEEFPEVFKRKLIRELAEQVSVLERGAAGEWSWSFQGAGLLTR